MMKKLLIVLSLIGLLRQETLAQIKVVKANGVKASAMDGVMYSLPLTVLRVDFDLVITEKVPGPLKKYSEKYLGIKPVIDEDQTDYEVTHAEVKPILAADYDNSYIILFNAEKGKDKELKPPFVLLTSQGLLHAYNEMPKINEVAEKQIEKEERIYVLGSEADDFHYSAEFNRKLKIDTIIRKITVDTMTIQRFVFRTSWVDKSEEERAADAASFIKTLRESRFNLLTGYHEVDFSGSIRYMDQELKKMEEDYLALFLGKENQTVRHYTYFYVPQANNLQKELFKSPEGDQLIVKVRPLNEPVVSETNAPVDNALVYRLPANCDVKVLFNRENLFNDIFPVNQLGVRTYLSVYKTSVLFDVQTGLPVLVKRN